MALVRLVTVVVLVMGMAACFEDSDEANGAEQKGAKTVAYTISKRDGDELKHIGNLRFDEANSGTIEILDDGPDGAELRAVWEEVSARSHLGLKGSRKAMKDGKEVTQFGTSAIPKGHAEYNVAAWDTLQREFHYHIDRLAE